MQTLRTNLKLNAPGQYTNFDYNSMCRFNGVLLGAGADGLFKACCGNDDDGVDIDAHFNPATVDLGEMYRRIRYLYFGLKGDGNLLLTVTTDLATVREYPVTLSGTGHQRVRVQLDRNVKGRYWDFKLANVDGSYFSVDFMQLLYF